MLIEVDWESLGVEGYANSYTEFFHKVYFLPPIEAFKAIAFDDMGREGPVDEQPDECRVCPGIRQLPPENRSGRRPWHRLGLGKSRGVLMSPSAIAFGKSGHIKVSDRA